MAFLNDLPIAELIANYGYIAIFVIITLESAGVPCPGETVLISAAVYAGSTGNLNIGLVIAAAAAAAILGDNVGYWAGRRWGMPLLLRYGHLIALDHGRLKLGQYLFRRHGGKIVFFGRFTAMLRATRPCSPGSTVWMPGASSPSTPSAASSGPAAWGSAPTIAGARSSTSSARSA